MGIGLIEITLILTEARLSDLRINSQNVDINNIYAFDKEHPIIATVEGSEIELSVEINGKVGNSVNIKVFQIATGNSYSSSLILLKNGLTKRIFKLSLNDLKSEANSSDNRFRDGIGFGLDERALIKPTKEKNHEVEIWYGTNRHIKHDENNNLHFDNEPDNLSLGKCLVNIPGDRKVGELNRPAWWKLEFRENANKHFKILSTAILIEEAFLLELRNKITDSSDQDAFIFIHGFNTSFGDGVLRTAQLAFDLGFKGAPIFYSWPSFGDMLNYPEDEIAVNESTIYFMDFLKLIQPVISDKKVHIIAHSMGNRLLTAALKGLSEEPLFKSSFFNQIIMAAPDLDAQDFINNFATYMTSASKRTTLYASSADTALRISRNMHSSIIRLGESGDYITCHKGLDTIDASKTDPTFIGHGYYANTSQLIGDIFQLFKFNFNPQLRNLLPNHSVDELYWSFR